MVWMSTSMVIIDIMECQQHICEPNTSHHRKSAEDTQ